MRTRRQTLDVTVGFEPRDTVPAVVRAVLFIVPKSSWLTSTSVAVSPGGVR